MASVETILALSLLRGVGRKSVHRLLRRCAQDLKLLGGGDVHRVAALLDTHFALLGLRLPPAASDLIAAYERAHWLLVECHRHDTTAVSFLDDRFPTRLSKLAEPPVLLYVRGPQHLIAAERGMAIVGTREPSDFGRESARRIARRVGHAGFVVVSGLATGIDTAAHEGCLEARGETVAVLAHGLDRVYPAENRPLAKRILDSGGALVSEYPPGTRAYPGNFVDRDRLQIGLSDALLVVETGVTGGTMHTVRFCQEQQKPLACIAHPPQYATHNKAQGNAKLLREDRAIPVRNSEDVESLCEDLRHGMVPTVHQSSEANMHFGFADE